MIFSKRMDSLITCIFLLFVVDSGFSQNSKAQLELKRQEVQKEIKLINELLFSNKKRKKAVYDDIENLNLKILRKEELVKLTNQQINLLNSEINQNLNKEADLNSELIIVKKDYRDMILNSYKAKSGKSRVMFLLSSESFFQAYKRVQYMKQFALFRKNQAIKISALVKELTSLNDRLKSQKDKKEEL